MRAISKLAPGWWDYTTLEADILNDAANASRNIGQCRLLVSPGREWFGIGG